MVLGYALVVLLVDRSGRPAFILDLVQHDSNFHSNDAAFATVALGACEASDLARLLADFGWWHGLDVLLEVRING